MFVFHGPSGCSISVLEAGLTERVAQMCWDQVCLAWVTAGRGERRNLGGKGWGGPEGKARCWQPLGRKASVTCCAQVVILVGHSDRAGAHLLTPGTQPDGASGQDVPSEGLGE